MGRTESEIRVALTGKDRSLGRTFQQAWKKADTFDKKMKIIGIGMQSFGRTMTMGVTLPIVAGFTLATKAAIDEQKEMALLEQALKKNVKATDEQVAAAERWVTKTQNWSGIADGELRPALAAIVRSTKDTTKAQELLGVAMDISVAKGKPLQTVADAIAKAYVGNTAALGRLGIRMKDAEGKALTFNEVMKKANETFGGAASKAADTTAGKLAILKARLADAAEEVGTALIPMVEKAADIVTKLAGAFNDLSPGMKDFAVKAALVAAAVGPTSWLAGGGIKVVLRLASAYKAVAKWAGLAAAAQGSVGGKGVGAGVGAGVGKALPAAGAGAAMPMAAMVLAAAAAVTPLVVMTVVQKTQQYNPDAKPGAPSTSQQNKGAGGAFYGSSKGYGGGSARYKAQLKLDTVQADVALKKWEKRYGILREKLSERLAMGEFDNADLLKRIDEAQEKVDYFRHVTREPFAVGHLKNSKWMTPIEQAEQKRAYFKSLLQQPITSGHLDVTPITNAIAHAKTSYTLMKSYLENTPISSHGSITITKNILPAHPQADGGDYIVRKPTLFLAGEAGTERATFTPLGRGGSPASSGGDTHIHVHVPAGTTLIGTAREVGEILAPHVGRALGREAARAGRRR